MAWKPIRAEPRPQSRYKLYHWCEDGTMYYLTAVTADSGLTIQEVVKTVMEGYACGGRYQAGQFKIVGGWHKMADLYYLEFPVISDEQLKLL